MTKRAKGLCFIKKLKDMQRVERLVLGWGGWGVFFLFIVNATKLGNHLIGLK